MARIIKSGTTRLVGASTSQDDFVEFSEQHSALDYAPRESAEIIENARREADKIIQEAERNGFQSGLERAELEFEQRMNVAAAAVEQCVAELQATKDSWLADWEKKAVHLARLIAEKILRRELDDSPKIAETYVHEALAMIADKGSVTIHLNPRDYETVRGKFRDIIDKTSGSREMDIVADESISAGGCRAETEVACIDQQIETQLARIEQELNS